MQATQMAHDRHPRKRKNENQIRMGGFLLKVWLSASGWVDDGSKRQMRLGSDVRSVLAIMCAGNWDSRQGVPCVQETFV